MYLISPHKKQYKANLHCHSKFSDGRRTPAEMKEKYMEKGYSILAITDHEVPKSHNELTDENFISITAYEGQIRTTPDGEYDFYEPEVHLNLFARDPENEAMVCYNPTYCKYLTEEQKEAYVKVGSQRPREHSVEYINEYIRTAKENGYICALNHPWWSKESEADLLAFEGIFSMEMCNFCSYQFANLEYNGGLYDKMLLKGKRVFCHSSDDSHSAELETDSFGAFTMIMPEEFTYSSIIDAMEKGEMYSSMGPTFKEVSIEGNKIHVECSDVERIVMHTGRKSPKRVMAEKGHTINSADFEIDDTIKFVRISIRDKDFNFADTRGFFKDELGL